MTKPTTTTLPAAGAAPPPVLHTWYDKKLPASVEQFHKAMEAEVTRIANTSFRLAVLIYYLHETFFPEPEQAQDWIAEVEKHGCSKVWAYKCYGGISFLLENQAKLGPFAKTLDIEKLYHLSQIPEKYLPMFWARHREHLGEYSQKQLAHIAGKYKKDDNPNAFVTCTSCGDEFIPNKDGEDMCATCRRKTRKKNRKSAFERLQDYDPAKLDPADEYAFAFIRLDRMLDAMSVKSPDEPMAEATLLRMISGLKEATQKVSDEYITWYGEPTE